MLRRVKSLKDGAYQFDEDNKLGSGSFATVYKGVINKNKRTVAIRLLPLNLIDQYGERIKEIIVGEVSVLKELSESASMDAMFTTKIFDCFMTQNNVVMILEYCPEGNLEDVLKNGPLPQLQALEILYQLARGLQFIARQKVVHRDIKPDNIFIKREGQHRIFKIGDFGFAVKKQLNHEIVGTPIFMSPELFKEESYGSEVDVWAFGLMVHYCLFKEHYFIAESEMKIKKKVLGERFELKKHHLSKISKQMADFLTLCLKKDKADRIPATQISRHPVFNPVRQQVEQMMKQVASISEMNERQLFKNSAKGQVMDHITKYSFLVDLSLTLGKINSQNYASLYMLRHALAELHAIQQDMNNRVNFIKCQGWNAFCSSEDYRNCVQILNTLYQKCERSFEASFNTIIPALRSNFGEGAVNGVIQNLGNGPYSRISSEAICYELKSNWMTWIQANKKPETHLLGLEIILALHVYNQQPYDFDFTRFELKKTSMSVPERTKYLESALTQRA